MEVVWELNTKQLYKSTNLTFDLYTNEQTLL